MTTAANSSDRKSNAIWLILGVAVIAVVVFALLYFFMFSRLTPEQFAEKYVNDNVDALGETIAGILTGGNPILRELGGEWVEDRIHEVVKWEYSTPRPVVVGGDIYNVVATAYVRFDVSVPLATGSVTAYVPFNMRVDEAAQTVLSATPDVTAARLDYDFPGVEAAVDKAVEAVSDAVDGQISSVTDALDTDDCIGAARNAGVPDRILSLLEKPRDELNSMERIAVRGGLDAVGLTEKCGLE